MFEVSVTALLIAWGVTFAGALVQGSVGFGLSVVAAPVLLMVYPAWVPGPMLCASVVLTSMVAWRDRHAIVPREVLLSTLGRASTTIPTAFLIGLIDQRQFSIAFSVVVLAAVGMMAGGYQIPFTRTNLLLASGLSGISTVISSIGGPPMALVYQQQRGDHMRATLSVIFLLGSLIAIASLACFGEFGWHDVELGFLLLPGIFTGFWVSRYTTPWLDARATRPAVLGVAALSAVVILLRAVGTAAGT